MALRDLSPGERLDVARDAPVVVVPLFGAHDLFVRCLRSLLAHTPAGVPILIADDAGPDPASHAFAQELDAAGQLTHDLVWLRQPENLGFVGNCNEAFAAAAPGDVVLVNSDVEVAAGWLEGLRDAAQSDTLIATATALTNFGTILSVPHRNIEVEAFPQDADFTLIAERVRTRSPKLRPRIPTAIGHCVYVRRQALDSVGGFDTAFAPAYGEEVDFSQKCVLRGMQHVAADDVVVLHHGRGSLNVDGARNPIQDAHEAIVANRYPAYHDAVEEAALDQRSPLFRSLLAARRAIIGLSIVVDGRCLTESRSGTQTFALELIGALHRHDAVAQLRVALPEHPGDYALEAIAALPGVETISELDQLGVTIEPGQVVHRPYQVTAVAELAELAAMGRRVVVTQQDLIAYRNPGYFDSSDRWQEYRKVTRETLRLADRVVFSSVHARSDALAEDIVPPTRADVVPLGVDHSQPRPDDVRVPEALAAQADVPFLLVLGTDFRHKNRVFALELLAALRDERGWTGRLVLAGPSVLHGSSAGDEAAWRSRNPQHEDAITTLPAVDEGEKTWLLEHATAVLYPTIYEGFGFVPFEAAAALRPCLFAPVTSLADALPDELATLIPWDASASAAKALPLLIDPDAARDHVAAVRHASEALTWDAHAEKVVAVYEATLDSPARDVGRADGDRVVPDAKYWHLRHEIGPTGMSLVDPDAPLLPQDAQRAIAALARRPATRKPLLGALKAIQRATGTSRGD